MGVCYLGDAKYEIFSFFFSQKKKQQHESRWFTVDCHL